MTAHPRAIVLARPRVGSSAAPLGRCLDRATALAGPGRAYPVLLAADSSLWSDELAARSALGAPVVEPCDRGNAVALLLGLFRLAEQCDPRETVLALTPRHGVADEGAWRRCLAAALAERLAMPGRILALAAPAGPGAPGLDWIVPGPPRAAGGCRAMTRFVPRADEPEARALARRGALVFTGALVGGLQDLFYLFEGTLPDLLGRFRRALWWCRDPRAPAVSDLYRDLPRYDLGRDVLARGSEWIEAFPVPAGAWSGSLVAKQPDLPPERARPDRPHRQASRESAGP